MAGYAPPEQATKPWLVLRAGLLGYRRDKGLLREIKTFAFLNGSHYVVATRSCHTEKLLEGSV